MGRSKNISTGCPGHGTEYMVTALGGVRYCGAPTPGELSSKCFYHPTTKFNPYNGKIDNDPVQPDVFRAMESEWDMHKRYKVINREKMRSQRKDIDVPTEIQSPEEILVAGSRNPKRKDGLDKRLPVLTYESVVADDDDITEDGNFLE